MLKPVYVYGKTIDDVYFQLLYSLWKNGRKYKITEGSSKGAYRLEFDRATGFIEFPTCRPLSPIFPEGVQPVVTESMIEDYFVNYLMDGTNLEDYEHYRYATWLRGLKDNDGIYVFVPDQVSWVINHFKEKGFGNNHCYMTIGYPESNFAYDIPYENEAERLTSPCLRGIDVKIIKDENVYKLCFDVYFRSWDLYAAWPCNIGGITLLMEYMACELNIDIGVLSFSSSKLHCYDYQIDQVKARLKCEE
jgi:thymidylate synthase